MAPIDPKTANPFSPREDQSGKGKEMLVGWLVGKAGVDFGVAQALAASEAQAAEQLNRLEETLVARINALQKEQKTDGETPESHLRQLSAFQADLQGFAKRMIGVEAAGQQMEQLGNNLRAEFAGLKAALVEQQSGLQPADAAIRRFEEALGARIQELHDRIVKAQDRLEGRETQLKEAFRTELIALQTQLGERQNRLDARHSTIEKLLENVSANFQSLEGWLSDKLRVIEDGSGNLEQLRSEMRTMAQRMAKVESAEQRAQAVVEAGGPTAEQLKRLEATLVARISELQNAQKSGGEVLEARERDLSDLRSGLRRFAGRIDLVESGGRQSEQASDALRGEIATLKAELAEQQSRFQPVDAAIQRVEEALGAKIQQLADQIAKGQKRLEGRDAQFTGMETELQRLGGRLAEEESAAQRLQTWVKRETESAGKLSEGLIAELAALRDQFNERRNKDLATEEFAAALGAKIEELKSQVGRRLSALESQDGERTEWIKALDQSFGAKFGELEHQLSEKLRVLEGGRDESGQLRSELSALVERIARQELTTQQAQAFAANEAQRTERLEDRLKAELAGLQADLNEQRQKTQPADSLIKGIEESLQPKIEQIGQHLAREQSRVESVEAEFAKLRSDLQALVEQQKQAASGVEQVRASSVAEAEAAAKLKQGLETELSALADRIARQESDAQQARTFADSEAQRMQQLAQGLKAEMAGLQAELKEQQQRTQPMDSLVKRIEESLQPKIDQFGQHLAREQARVESLDGQFAKFKSDLQVLAERQEQVAAGAEQGRAWAAGEAESAARLRERLESELSALRVRLDERYAAEIAFQGIDAALGAKIEELQSRLGQQLSSADGRQAERAEWMKAAEQNLDSKMQALEERLSEKLRGLESGSGELRQLKSEVGAVAERMSEMEFAAQRAQTIVASDAPTAERMKRLEETLAARIGEMQRRQQIDGENLVGRERELSALRLALQDVLTRMGRFEFAAHETGQLSNGLRGEIDSLKSEIAEQRQRLGPMDSALRGIEAAFSAKLEDLRNQFVGKTNAVDGGGYLEEFKETKKSITERAVGEEPAAVQIQTVATGGDQAAVRDAMEREAAPVQTDTQPTDQPFHRPTTTVESSPNRGEQGVSADSEKEQQRQLQQRMSAEIERVRAELKEKSGRWKVRKGAVGF